MISWRALLVCLLLSGAPLASGAAPLSAGIPLPPSVSSNSLVWDALNKEAMGQPNQRYATFRFWFTNVSEAEVIIRSAQSSCFCTVAKLPAQPWPIPPGSNGSLEVTMDLAGKHGTVMKGVFVDSSAGPYNLTVKTVVAASSPRVARTSMNDAERLKNIQAALADRQAVFKRPECAACHADPAKAKGDGAALYAAVCANCHDSPFRASTVPDLHALAHLADLEHWRRWISYGRAGSMMPAFTQAEGGPLSEQQIDALARYLTQTISSRARPIPAGGGGSWTRP